MNQSRRRGKNEEPDEKPKKSTNSVLMFVVVILAGLVVCLCLAMGVGGAVVAPSLVKAKARATELQAQGRMKSIVTGQELYKINNKEGQYATSLKQLVDAGYISPGVLNEPDKDYDFKLAPNLEGKRGFMLHATPTPKAVTTREFRCDQSGEIESRADSSAPWAKER